eukprot:TRINITY_DN32962_c0_g1_i1.p1 TRINITY_DN32962_c0_g1~~TRINITY_DN32962_c0_g1_i1.p1  ORF type:complete len:1408 (+),score=321.58 TRINITY_DN32962_c0_g1_i1:119-4342(+)
MPPRPSAAPPTGRPLASRPASQGPIATKTAGVLPTRPAIRPLVNRAAPKTVATKPLVGKSLVAKTPIAKPVAKPLVGPPRAATAPGKPLGGRPLATAGRPPLKDVANPPWREGSVRPSSAGSVARALSSGAAASGPRVAPRVGVLPWGRNGAVAGDHGQVMQIDDDDEEPPARRPLITGLGARLRQSAVGARAARPATAGTLPMRGNKLAAPWSASSTPSSGSRALYQRDVRQRRIQQYEEEEEAAPPEKKEAPTHDHLPIRLRADEVIPQLCAESTVCCLVGETGSGKSTQVPQMLMEEAAKNQQPIRVCVTQPRRVAALNLAKRVMEEIGEENLGESIGYRIGGESLPGEHIDFCTTGYLLQLLLNAPEEFGRYTHIVIDEVHERSSENDLLCLVVRLLVLTANPGMRLVIMSATMQSDLFSKYFSVCTKLPVAQVFVGARCFPVEEIFLDELPSRFKGQLMCQGEVNKRIQDLFSEQNLKPDKVKRLDPRHCEKFQGIVVDVIRLIAEPGGTILVFLPGISEISSLWEEARYLEEEGGAASEIRVYPLHSMIPREEQEMVFKEPPEGVTNVVLATDIAESSITLPHVTAVIDLGLHRRVDHSSNSTFAALATKWISKAAAKQRSGRAGRTQPGVCIRMYTSTFKEKCMTDFEPPEAQAMPLHRLYLQAKQLAEKLAVSMGGKAPGTAKDLLLGLVQPPDVARIHTARETNAEMGTICGGGEEAKITALGRLCLQLPVDLKVGRLVWLGVLYGIPADAVVLGAAFSSNEPFSSPTPLFIREEQVFVDKLRGSTSARLLFDGGSMSEPLMQRQLFLELIQQFHKEEWVYGSKAKVAKMRRQHTADFCIRYSLSRGRMEHMVSHVQELALRVHRACEPGTAIRANIEQLIQGLGYTVNNRGDLAGVRYEEWQPFQHEDVFEQDPSFLKAVMATAYSDQLLVGTYSPMGNNTIEMNETKKSKGDEHAEGAAMLFKRSEKILKAIVDNGLDPRRTAIFSPTANATVTDPQDLLGYIELVCGMKPETDVMLLEAGNEKFHVVEFNSEGINWPELVSRASNESLSSPVRLTPEFILLYQFEKSMNDAKRSNSQLQGFTYGLVPVQHPCLLKWEWLNLVPLRGGKDVKLVRSEARFDRKNAPGCMAHVEGLADGRLRKVACFATCGHLQGSEKPGRVFPSGVTALAPCHLPFVLVSANVSAHEQNLKRFAFTTSGHLALLHRTFQLPDGVIDRHKWAGIAALRDALHRELQVDEKFVADGGSWKGHLPSLYDSEVKDLARELFRSLPPESEGQAALEDPEEPKPRHMPYCTVELMSRTKNICPPGSPEAFWPLATWPELHERRQVVIARLQGGSRGSSDHSRRGSSRDRRGGQSGRSRSRDRRSFTEDRSRRDGGGRERSRRRSRSRSRRRR